MRWCRLTEEESLHEETLPCPDAGCGGAYHGPDENGRSENEACVEALHCVCHRIRPDKLSEVEYGCRPA